MRQRLLGIFLGLPALLAPGSMFRAQVLSQTTLITLEESCTRLSHQPYDNTYVEAHRADYFRLFPLSSKCNADYDLVPAWVNPTVAVLFLLFVASVAGLVWTTAIRLRQTSSKKGEN